MPILKRSLDTRIDKIVGPPPAYEPSDPDEAPAPPRRKHHVYLQHIAGGPFVCLKCLRIVPIDAHIRYLCRRILVPVSCKSCGHYQDPYSMFYFGLLLSTVGERAEANLAEAKTLFTGDEAKWDKLYADYQVKAEVHWNDNESFSLMMRRIWYISQGKAIARLRELLTERQKRSLFRFGHFDVIGSDGQKYRLYFSVHSNIGVVKKGKVMRGWCYNLGDSIPIGDTLIGQLLMIETNAPEFFAAANPQQPEHMSGVGAYSDSVEVIRRAYAVSKLVPDIVSWAIANESTVSTMHNVLRAQELIEKEEENLLEKALLEWKANHVDKSSEIASSNSEAVGEHLTDESKSLVPCN